MLIWKMIAGVIYGLGLHQINRLFEQVELPADVDRVSRYMVGYGGAFPIFWLIVRPMPRKWRWLVTTAYWTCGAAVGCGVVLGYVMDIFAANGGEG